MTGAPLPNSAYHKRMPLIGAIPLVDGLGSTGVGGRRSHGDSARAGNATASAAIIIRTVGTLFSIAHATPSDPERTNSNRRLESGVAGFLGTNFKMRHTICAQIHGQRNSSFDRRRRRQHAR